MADSSLPDNLRTVYDYHDRTKHQLDRYARSLGYMDWANQPDPFRRYRGRSPAPSGIARCYRRAHL